MAYCTAAQVKTHLGIASSNTDSDALLATLVDGASAAVDIWTRRTFAAQLATRYFDFQTATRLWFGEDCYSITSLTCNDGTVLTESTHYYLYPLNGPPYAWLDIRSDVGTTMQYTGTRQRAITVVGKWGYSLTPPPAVVQATISWTAYVFARATRGAMGASSLSIGEYSVSFGDVDALLKEPPGDVKLLLNGLRSYSIKGVTQP